MSLRCIAILPARLGSTRLPRKVLLDETGLPLFVHTARNAGRCPSLDRVLVATDSAEVMETAKVHGVAACLTRTDHQSGTDRVREAYESLGQEWDVVVNVQADEPDLEPLDLESLMAAFADPSVVAATLAVPLQTESEWLAESTVKVVVAASGDALYFSRAPIPTRMHARDRADAALGFRHLGVYAFRPDALRRFCDLPPGRLESLENLEQLRWLENGQAMRVVTATRAPRGIDTPEDYAEFKARQASCQAGEGASDPKGASTQAPGFEGKPKGSPMEKPKEKQ